MSKKTPNSTQAMVAAPAATPVKPSPPAPSDTTRASLQCVEGGRGSATRTPKQLVPSRAA